MESMRGTVHTFLTPAMEDGGTGGGQSMQTYTHSRIRTQSQPQDGEWGDTRHRTERDRGFNDHAVRQLRLPIRLGLLLSLLLLLAVERNSLPQQAPVPGSPRQAVLVPSLLRLYRVIIAVYVIYQRHCASRSAKRQHHKTVAMLRCAADGKNRPRSDNQVRFDRA